MAALRRNFQGAFAQFERELIRQRQAEGNAEAKKRGIYKGRPRTLDSEQIRSVRNAALAGTPKPRSHVTKASADPRCTATSRRPPCRSEGRGRENLTPSNSATISNSRSHNSPYSDNVGYDGEVITWSL